MPLNRNTKHITTPSDYVPEDFIIVRDTFTDTNGVGLDAHTPDIDINNSGWVENSGTWEIQSNYLQQNITAPATNYATIDAKTPNVRMRLILRTENASGNSQAGVIARFTDIDNYFKIMMVNTAGVDTIYIHRVEEGTPVELDSQEWPGGTRYQKWEELIVDCDGDDITIHVNGGYPIKVSDSFNNTVTKFGLIESTGATTFGLKYDEFEIITRPRYPFTKYGTVLSATGVAEDGNVQEPMIIIDTNPQILTSSPVVKLWYTGGYATAGVYYAESADGITFTKYDDETPVLATLFHFHIIKDDGKYLLYGPIQGDGDQYDLYTSSDGVSWSLDTAAVLEVGTGGQWDDSELGNPFVWKEGPSDWRMLYEAMSGGLWRIGYATSSDGRSWSKYGSNPVINPDRGSGVSGPELTISGKYYYLWTHQQPHGSAASSAIGRFRSTDLITWEPWPWGTYVHRDGADEGQDTMIGQVADPAPIEINNQVYLYYEATSDGFSSAGNMHIILAIADKRAIIGW